VDVVYGIGRVDASGRIANRAVTSAGLARREPADPDRGRGRGDRPPRSGGMITLPDGTYIAIPAALRRRCGLRSGDRVLLAAVPSDDTLTAYSFAVVDQAIRAHAAFPHAQGGQL
jgi:hypothetical protein